MAKFEKRPFLNFLIEKKIIEILRFPHTVRVSPPSASPARTSSVEAGEAASSNTVSRSNRY
jgi:hypothetical protein